VKEKDIYIYIYIYKEREREREREQSILQLVGEFCVWVLGCRGGERDG
jgi:hypothetical protein